MDAVCSHAPPSKLYWVGPTKTENSIYAKYADTLKPRCKRCEKAGLECLGYDKPTIFINVAPDEGVSPVARDESEFIKGQSTLLPDVASYTEVLAKPSLEGRVAQHGGGDPNYRLHLCAFKDGIVISHLVSRLDIGLEGSSLRDLDAPVLLDILTSYDSSSLAYTAGLCFAEALFGHTYKVKDITEHSVQLYSSALSSLRKNLAVMNQNTPTAQIYVHLWTSLLLSMYELVSSTELSNWKEHACGVIAIVSQCFLSRSAYNAVS